MIGIVDYGAGNLNSVRKAFRYLNKKTRIIQSPKDTDGIKKIVLPGVGSFGAALEKIRKSGFFPALEEWLKSNRPFLGICLGLQLLFEFSEEAPGVPGLRIFRGKCRRLEGKKVPHMGWNRVSVQKKDSVFKGIHDREFFYFVHSYYALPEDSEIEIGRTDYGIEFSSVIRRGNIYAVQFHPEKSGRAGLLFLKNWVMSC